MPIAGTVSAPVTRVMAKRRQAADIEASLPAPAVFHDGLGTRVRLTDPVFEEAVERLYLCPDLQTQQAAVRDRTARLANFRHVRFPRLRGVDQDAEIDGTPLYVAADPVDGYRLSEVLDFVDEQPLTLDINAALQVPRELLPALAVFHDSRNVTHGCLGPERLVLTSPGRVTIVEHGLGLALEKVQFPRTRLWREFRVAMPPSAGLPKFDTRADVAQIALVTLELILGRRLRAAEFPDGLRGLLDQAVERLANGTVRPLSPALSAWFERALPHQTRRPFNTALDAQVALEEAIKKERLYAPSSSALKAFLQRFEARRALVAPAVASTEDGPTSSTTVAVTTPDAPPKPRTPARARRATPVTPVTPKASPPTRRLTPEEEEEEEIKALEAELARLARLEADEATRAVADLPSVEPPPPVVPPMEASDPKGPTEDDPPAAAPVLPAAELSVAHEAPVEAQVARLEAPARLPTPVFAPAAAQALVLNVEGDDLVATEVTDASAPSEVIEFILPTGHRAVAAPRPDVELDDSDTIVVDDTGSDAEPVEGTRQAEAVVDPSAAQLTTPEEAPPAGEAAAEGAPPVAELAPTTELVTEAGLEVEPEADAEPAWMLLAPPDGPPVPAESVEQPEVFRDEWTLPLDWDAEPEPVTLQLVERRLARVLRRSTPKPTRLRLAAVRPQRGERRDAAENLPVRRVRRPRRPAGLPAGPAQRQLSASAWPVSATLARQPASALAALVADASLTREVAALSQALALESAASPLPHRPPARPALPERSTLVGTTTLVLVARAADSIPDVAVVEAAAPAALDETAAVTRVAGFETTPLDELDPALRALLAEMEAAEEAAATNPASRQAPDAPVRPETMPTLEVPELLEALAAIEEDESVELVVPLDAVVASVPEPSKVSLSGSDDEPLGIALATGSDPVSEADRPTDALLAAAEPPVPSTPVDPASAEKKAVGAERRRRTRKKPRRPATPAKPTVEVVRVVPAHRPATLEGVSELIGPDAYAAPVHPPPRPEVMPTVVSEALPARPVPVIPGWGSAATTPSSDLPLEAAPEPASEDLAVEVPPVAATADPPAVAPSLFAWADEASDETPAVAVERAGEPARRRFDWRSVNWRRTAAAVIVLALIEGVAFAAAYWFVKPTELGVLRVSTTTPGVEVVIDGRSAGKTPLSLELRQGRYTIELRGRSRTKVVPVEIAAGVQTSQLVKWSEGRSVGTLKVTSTPPGARVVIGGLVRGTTPLEIEDLPAGGHEVLVESDAGSVRESVRVRADEVVEVDIPVFSGWLAVFAPVELRIFAQGRMIGTTADGRILMPPGRHDVELVNASLGIRHNHTVEIRPGRVEAISLEAPNGTLDVDAPVGTEVVVNGQRLGVTPLEALTLPVGTHEVVLRHPMLGQRRVVVSVGAGVPAKVSLLAPQ